MLTLTLSTNKDSTISYTTENPHLQTIGEFLVTDAVQMPDFIRALLISGDEELIAMDACSIQTRDPFVIIKHLYLKDLPIVTLPKERLLQILDIWEDFLVEKNPTQWLFFKEEEFGLPASTDKHSEKLQDMEKKMNIMMQAKNKQKETE